MTTSFTIRQDRHGIRPTDRSERFLLAHIEAPTAMSGRPRPSVNLAIVLDRSGSMSGAKLRVAREAVEEAIARLEPSDRFSIVVYDDQIDVVVESTPASSEARARAVECLRAVDARGSTNLGEGWLRGCEQVAAHLASSGVNRCLLLTDGLANVGLTDPEELAAHARELRARGVSTSTFGVGTDFDEGLLQAIADAGGGHFYYVADAAQIRDAITGEVGETLQVVALDAMLELTAREEVRIESLSPYPVTEVGGRTSIGLGDLGSSQALDVVLRVTFPYGDLGRDIGISAALRDRDGVFATLTEPIRLAWTYVDQAEDAQQSRDVDVDRAVARVFAARAREEAVRRNRNGDFDQASQALATTAARIIDFAGDDHDLAAVARSLSEEQAVFAAPMAETARKAHHFSSSNLLRSRSDVGGAVRRG